MILCCAVLLLTVPLAAGLFAGQRDNFVRDFLLCFGAVLALSAGYMAFICHVNLEISGVLLKTFSPDYYELSKAMQRKLQIPLSWIIGGSLYIFAVLYLLSFCVRRYCRSWWKGVIFLILAITVINSSFMIFYHSIGWLAIWQADDYLRYPAAKNGIMTLVILNCLLIFWTVWVMVRKNLNWKKLAEAAAIYLGLGVALWFIAFAGTYFYRQPLLKKAELAGIEPLSIKWQDLPPEMQTMSEDLEKFRKAHPLFFLPTERELTQEEREYTLKNFDSPEMLKYYALYEKLVFYPRDRKNICADMWHRTRDYTRIQTGRARLYCQIGKPEKALPVLMKLIEFDRREGNAPWLMDELIRNVCRSMWIAEFIQSVPDDKKYAPFCREALEYLKNSKPHIPSEAGVWLAEHRITGFGTFLALPSFYAQTAKALNFNLSPELKKLEEQEVFVNPKNPWENGAMKSRNVISAGSIGMALKCYRMEHGQYPEKPDMLLPEYLPRIPVASDNGLPFEYRTDGKEFMLKSTNWTLKSSEKLPAALEK